MKNLDEKTSSNLYGLFVALLIIIVIFLCSDGNSQECDKLYGFTKKTHEPIMDATPILYGVYECINVGTNLTQVRDTVTFAIFVQKKDQEAELFGVYIMCPDGKEIILPTLTMVIDERIVVGVSSNAPIGTKFYICLRQIYEKEKAFLYK